MGIEIERKFLLKDDSWKGHVTRSFNIVQGYLSRDPARTVRIRRRGDEAFLTIKGQPDNTPGAPIMVAEFEYPIPAQDADALLALCLPGAISKTRHLVPHGRHTWEIDVFEGENKGLVVAEIELASADEAFDLPAWVGDDVSNDRSYTNAALSSTPFSTWKR